jgi:hypothetical protein
MFLWPRASIRNVIPGWSDRTQISRQSTQCLLNAPLSLGPEVMNTTSIYGPGVTPVADGEADEGDRPCPLAAFWSRSGKPPPSQEKAKVRRAVTLRVCLNPLSDAGP